MLVLSRKSGEHIHLITASGELIDIVINKSPGNGNMRVCFQMPDSCLALRGEIYEDLCARGVEPANPEALRDAMVRLRAARAPA
ncbi:MAG: carbon storage regulator [Alphaproteobacteria bacterium]|nr:MAG: carbon storage regulator [Alphaproteobacteria bacterium]